MHVLFSLFNVKDNIKLIFFYNLIIKDKTCTLVVYLYYTVIVKYIEIINISWNNNIFIAKNPIWKTYKMF